MQPVAVHQKEQGLDHCGETSACSISTKFVNESQFAFSVIDCCCYDDGTNKYPHSTPSQRGTSQQARKHRPRASTEKAPHILDIAV